MARAEDQDNAPHKKVLISNRGEIAIRVAKAATSLGMESVAAYAPIDSLSLHTRFATEKYEIGRQEDSVDAYLDIESLIQVATDSRCDCVHPGYGFLSENAEFARLCESEGITFIGPSHEALSLFGDKVRSRALAKSLDIPVVPGGTEPLSSAAEAEQLAKKFGYPVMLKASAGGGGRGMRIVEQADQMVSLFDRCTSEAESAFGNGALFIEKLVARPRHIEVQILADSHGNVVHLHERDCSVQLRNQKVIELAPAPGLDKGIRERILNDAIRLAREASYVNAGTVEFLVSPETGEYFFIECNPRIQVEHTITEQITGVDIVEAQFHIAAGASLESLGLKNQRAIGSPRGFSIQARVVAQSAGDITAYKEPSGVGVRVDACGYLGYSPPPQFDPLLAKVICYSGSLQSEESAFPSAIKRLLHALENFHIGGLQNNLAQLHAILSHPDVQAGDARTTLLDETPQLLSTALPELENSSLNLFDQQAPKTDSVSVKRVATPKMQLTSADDQTAVECPMDSTVIEVHVKEGDHVAIGDTLLVVSAMKMETLITAPCSGSVTAMLPLAEGDNLAAGQILIAITPSSNLDGQSIAANKPDQNWGVVLEEVGILQDLAKERLAPGSEDPGVVRQRSRGKLTCRERILLLLDDDSFREVGSVTGFASYDEAGAISGFTPANSVGGWGTIENRTTIVCADDFTSRGGHSDGAIAAKSGYLDRLSIEMRIPSVRMLDGSSGGGSVAAMVPAQKKEGESKAKESSGAIKAGRPRVAGGGGSFLPGHLGSSMYMEQLTTVPVVNLLLGSVVGLGAAKAVLGHFSVMVRDIAQLFVAGPPVVSHAMGYDITKEELGGWHIHCTNGSVDNLAETEEEAVAMTREFLSYLPPSVYEAPPVTESDDPTDRREEELFTLISRKRTTTFDMRKAIKLMVDKGSFFEIGPLWGTDQITGFARFNGYPVGVIASDSQHVNGGALTADGCDKLTRHLDLCDLFHLPILNLIDNPGFAVGLEHEITGTIRKGGEWMIAFAQVTVPIFTVVMRRSFGVAGNNYATPRSKPSVRVAWPAADVGGIPPEGGIEAAYKRQLAEAEDPAALRAELEARIESARGPVGPLNRFQMEEMIDPRDTRRYICEWIETAFKIVTQPARLVPRALQFRP
ncbi:MAG TPA: carboxyl transferase domain-containing protein [Pseudomonadales bacterium]|jgi:acetyl/propionyl-CoA carboxylase alpha subunit/acetyl-CoA carboxylase carboxyltransferase component|nr:carboxyl transferase domain-containing protein [Pseudomonadales bacterium]MDP7315039.1 carboxyl transferase domain-containing protein [Pseudomonadales bacterium]HJP50967.1 carboxyl transferase domain-containing protein [Pseudomonadales bacterium]|tara:strand:+ start:2804 stop:6241 length:3438 start_codon:yes stop_codon:yes gene_type:complete